jgi:membrane protease YdiL (CAAX protease family)
MKLRAIFKDAPFLCQLLITIVVVFTGALLGVFAYTIYMMAVTGNWNVIMPETANDMRVMQFFSTLGTFFFPALLLAYVFSGKAAGYLQLRKPRLASVFLTVLAVLVARPFLNLTVYLNERLVLPEFMHGLEAWMQQMEETARQLILQMLQADNAWILIFNIFLLGLLAAVGEEFMFRGVTQRVFEKLFRNPHAVIWTVAVIFSAIHLQFYGFVPRMLLGALMGYLLLWTKSLWVPVTAHFTNNAIGVLLSYFASGTKLEEQLESIGTGHTIWTAAVSLAMTWCLCLMIKRVIRVKSSHRKNAEGRD